TVVARPACTADQWYFAVDVVDAVVYGAVAWLLLGRVRHPVSWILALTAVGGGSGGGRRPVDQRAAPPPGPPRAPAAPAHAGVRVDPGHPRPHRDRALAAAAG